MTPEEAEEARSAAAGEYVLGTFSRAERTAFELKMQREPALLAEIYHWQDRLLPLAARVPPAQPRAETWLAIEAALGPPAAVLHAAQDMQHGRVGAAANDAVWKRLRRWQWIGSGALAASVMLAAVLGVQMLAPPAAPPARYLAVLQAPQDQSTGWIVEVTSGDRVRLIPVGTASPVPAGKSLQFWTKAENAAGPTSLGLVAAGRVTELPAAVLPALGERQLFEVTLEPEGGSTVGWPTGPVLFLGRTLRL